MKQPAEPQERTSIDKLSKSGAVMICNVLEGHMFLLTTEKRDLEDLEDSHSDHFSYSFSMH